MRPFLHSARAFCTRHPAAVGALGTFLLSLLLRVLYLNGSMDRDWPFSIFFYGDTRFFHGYALEWARGAPAQVALPYHPPLFPAFLGLLYQLLGEPQRSAFPYKLSLAVLNSATVAFTGWWWRRVLGTGWSLVAAGLFAASFGWLVLSTTYSNEVLYALLLSATLWLVLQARAGLAWWAAVLLGIVMGLGSLTRAEHLYLWPFLLAYLVFHRDRQVPWKPQLPRWAVAVAVCLAVLAPWSIRNARILQELNARNPSLEPLPELTLVTIYGPINFAMANNAGATGGFTPDLVNQLGMNGNLDVANPAQRHLLLHGYAEGLRWMSEHPGDAAKLWLAKLGRWQDGLSLGFGVSNWPSGLRGARPPVDVFLPESTWFAWPLTLLLLAGAVLSLREPYRAFSLFTLVVLHRALITLAFFGYARGLLVIFPALLPLLLLPVVALAAALASLRAVLSRRLPLFALAALLLLWAEAGLRALGEPRNFNASGSTDQVRGKLIQDDWVQIWPKT